MFQQTEVRLCIVHLVRTCLNYVSWKQRKEVAADLKAIYRASTAEESSGIWKPSPRSGTAAPKLPGFIALAPGFLGQKSEPSPPSRNPGA